MRDIRHHAPISNVDFDFFYNGLEDGHLLIQKCGACGKLRNPPSPMCYDCGSVTVHTLACAGTGTVHSWVVHHHPPMENFPVPHTVVLVDLDEGVRMLGAFKPSEIDRGPFVGMKVHAVFGKRGDLAVFEFTPGE